MAVGSFADVIASELEGVKVFAQDGKCSNCGQCCSNILPISDVEILRIKKYIEKHEIAEQILRYPMNQPVLNMKCPFRDDSQKKCLIYEVRPAICRDFQCDKPQKKIYADRDLYHGKYAAVDMRSVFYGKRSFFEQMMEELVGGNT